MSHYDDLREKYYEEQAKHNLYMSQLVSKAENPIEPPHYRNLSPEPIVVIESWGLDYHLGSALKYIARAGKKEGNPNDQDIRKAIWFLQRYVDTHHGFPSPAVVDRETDVIGC